VGCEWELAGYPIVGGVGAWGPTWLERVTGTVSATMVVGAMTVGGCDDGGSNLVSFKYDKKWNCHSFI